MSTSEDVSIHRPVLNEDELLPADRWSTSFGVGSASTRGVDNSRRNEIVEHLASRDIKRPMSNRTRNATHMIDDY